MKTLIAIPCMDQVSAVFVESLLNLEKPEGTKVCMKRSSLVYDSRNLLSLTAIENCFDNVLWLDSDMQFEPDLLVRMQAHATNNEDMVTGVYFRRTYPCEPVIYRELTEPQRFDGVLQSNVKSFVDYPEDDTFYVAGCGFGACLTSTKLLRNVWNDFGPPFSPLPWCGEDLSFCYRVNELGYQILCDSTIKLGHIGQAIFTEDIFKKNRGGANENR